MNFVLSPFAQYVGIEIIEMVHGKSRILLNIQPFHKNQLGIVHGGVISTVADVAAGLAIASTTEKGQIPLTTDSYISYLKAVRGEQLDCNAEIIHKSNKNIRVESSVYSGDELIAKAMISFAVKKD